MRGATIQDRRELGRRGDRGARSGATTQGTAALSDDDPSSSPKEQDNRAITPARNDFAIACRDQPVHLLRRQISRQVGKPPMGIARNEVGENLLGSGL
jgi:hypothetical protein